ncbi:VanZ family protein [Olivibacter sp. XZL3]|uniref:VanZ family protein n=1 Tax=Olivibacter sp. XZL3 TaxID=1735116 RepID=UPI0014170F9B|nr:VanZ family protein [Olivibacter sp. XZL3]
MRWMWRAWCVLYFFILIYVVFFAGRRPSPTWGLDNNQQPLLIPFRLKWYQYTHAYNLSDVYLDVIGNIIMFVPMSLFLYIVFGVRKYSRLFLIGFLASLIIEIVQYVTGIGIPDIDDLIFNTAGAFLGIVVIDGVRRAILSNSGSPL